MAHITARSVAVEFPLYGLKGRSFKTTFIHAATGGLLAKDAGNRVVVRALDGLTFDIREGDRIGIMGHNGSGKTTLLRVLAGAYEPTAGSIEISGRVASMLSIGLGMDADSTGYENIFVRATIMGLRPAEIPPLAEEICAFADLGEYIHMPLRTYSSGMSVRLAFAISTSVSPDIILMDEWLSVVDAAFRDKAQQRLKNALDRARILVLASHDERLIRQTCSRIMRLDHGRIAGFEPAS
jgi:lipopolysaccharide transport system ATP-binding protein